LIQSTMGAELCATHRNPSPKPSECVKAADHTYKGIIDITNRVEIGTPVVKSPHHWRVPYNVADSAGNKAATVWRDVVVEEVDIFDLEHKVRREVLAEQDKAVKDAVRKALTEERAKQTSVEKASKTTKNRAVDTGACPSCPACKCPTSSKESEFDVASKCNTYCETEFSGVCPTSQHFSLSELLMDGSTHSIALYIVGAIALITLARFLVTLMFNPAAFFGTTDYNYNNVNSSVYSGGSGATAATAMTQPRPPSFSDPGGGGVSFFSPPSDRQQPQYGGGGDYRVSTPQSVGAGLGQSNGFDESSIYAGNADDIISPSKTGGVRRRHF
jgi:hypothetical protein